MIQETKLRKKGDIKIPGYQIFELNRKDSNGGGLITGVKEELSPVLIMEGDNEIELLVIEANLSSLQVRIFNGYGPQENDSLERRIKFMVLELLQKEILC